MSKQIKNITLGSDPEVFLVEKETKRIVSAIPYVMGDKYSPYQIPELEEGHCIQTDNIMVEYCLPATSSSKELFNSFMKCIDWTNKIIPGDLETKVQAFGYVDEEFLAHPDAQRFGCEPDFNAWQGGRINPRPNGKQNCRSCGGHVHIGYDNPDYEDQLGLIKALDIFLSIPSIILDEDKDRKKMYGKAGAFRFKNYGVEYRSLSNFWLQSQELVDFVFEGVNKAVDFFNQGKVDQLTDEDQLEIQTCINTGDEILAYKLINKFKLESLINKIVEIN